MASDNAAILADCSFPDQCRISPNGKDVVYCVRERWSRRGLFPTSELWTAEVGKANSARRLTVGNFNDSDPQFSPCGKYLSFVSDRTTPGRASTIYVLPIEGFGEATPLTPITNQMSIVRHLWSPDGKTIAFISADEWSEARKTRERSKDDARIYGQDPEYGRLRILEMGTKAIYTLIAGDYHVWTFAWKPDGSHLAFSTRKTPDVNHSYVETDIYTVSLKGEAKIICQFGAKMEDFVWHDRHIYWIGKPDGKTPQSSYAVWRVCDGEAPERVSHGIDDCARGIRCCGSDLVVYVQDRLIDKLESASETLLTSEENIVAWDVWKKVVVVIKASRPGATEVFSDNVQLSTHNQALYDLQPCKTLTLDLSADDGTEFDGVVYTPLGLEKPHPAVIVPHGGPYHRVSPGMDALWTLTSLFLSLGYAVLSPNYRGGSGRGAKFAEAVLGNPAASYQDVMCLVKRCVKDGLIDEQRIAIAGWSQGGFLAYLAVTRDKFAAAIAGAGVCCWDSMIMNTDVPDFEYALAGGAPWLSSLNDVNLRQSSPLWHMDSITTPLLILHGEADVRAPVNQAIAFHRGMLAKGKECEMITYPREGHGNVLPFERTHYIHMILSVQRFLEKHNPPGPKGNPSEGEVTIAS